MKYIILCCLSVSVLVSCASVPQKEYEEATALKERASRYEPVRNYDSSSFQTAEENYKKAEGLIKEKKELKTAKESLITASENYQKVIDKGMPAYAETLTNDINKTLDESNKLKANVSLEKEYVQAENLYNEAKALIASSDYYNALEKLEDVKKRFEEIYTEIKMKYDESLKSVEAVQQRLKKLEKMAEDIDKMRTEK